MPEIDYSKVNKLPPYPGATSTSGRWIAPATGTITTLNTLLNRLYVDDIYVPDPIQFNQMAVVVTNAGTAGAIMRMGLYEDNDEMPGQLIAEAIGTVDTTTIGTKTLNINTGILPPGRYWLAAVSQVAACSVYGNSKHPDQRWATNPTAVIQYADVGYAHDGISGSLPQTFVSVGDVDVAARSAIRIL